MNVNLYPDQFDQLFLQNKIIANLLLDLSTVPITAATKKTKIYVFAQKFSSVSNTVDEIFIQINSVAYRLPADKNFIFELNVGDDITGFTFTNSGGSALGYFDPTAFI
jgi:hypothetical protein